MSANQNNNSGNFLENMGPFLLFVALMFGVRWLRGDFKPKPDFKMYPQLQQFNLQRPNFKYEPPLFPQVEAGRFDGFERASHSEKAVQAKD